MNKAILILLLAAVSYSCGKAKPDATAFSETASTEAFGAAVEETNVLPAARLESILAGRDSVQATISSEIVESCQSKGCWMDVKLSNGRTMKVTFRDYGFFMPVEDLKGRQVVFTGTATRETVSVEDQRHYAKDAGKTDQEVAAITTPKEELRFVADGVIFK